MNYIVKSDLRKVPQKKRKIVLAAFDGFRCKNLSKKNSNRSTILILEEQDMAFMAEELALGKVESYVEIEVASQRVNIMAGVI